MIVLRVIYRMIGFLVLTTGYLAEGFFAAMTLKDPVERKKSFTRITSFYCFWGLRLLGVTTTLINAPDSNQNHLYVSNHMGFLDILCLAANYNSVYITSVEMQKTPFLGLLCEMGGCIFIERRSRDNLKSEIEVVANTLREGFNVTIYPEGTSGDASEVLPFKKSFLVSSYDTPATVKPFVLNYRVNGEPLTKKTAQSVCWHGDTPFVVSLLKLFSAKRIDAELRFFESRTVNSPEERREIAAWSYDLISKHFVPVSEA